MARVLVALDDSDTAVHVARRAHELFGDDSQYFAINVGDQVVLPDTVTSVPFGVAYPYVWADGRSTIVIADGVDLGDVEDAREEEARDQAQAAAEAGGIDDAEAIGGLGDPAGAIASEAERQQVDVIVVGSTERSLLSRLVNPSVAKGVESLTSIPVLVVETD